MPILDILTELALIMNCGIFYFTSETIRATFVGVDYEDLVDRIKATQFLFVGPVGDQLKQDIYKAGSEAISTELKEANALHVGILTPGWDIL